MRSIGTASFFALCLAIAGCNNGTTTATDAGGGGTDTGNGGTDTGTPPTDTGTPPTDTGTPAEDTGTPAVDANVQADANLPTGCEGFHGCTAATATDMTGMSAVSIGFGVGLTYAPDCVRISAGTVVTIAASGGVGGHPLRTAACAPSDTPLPTTPVEAPADYTFENPGLYGFECAAHASLGMQGLIIVE